MSETKLLSLLGMCRRAGKLCCGHDSAVGAVREKQAALCLLSSDSSERLRKEFERECSFGGRDIPVKVISSGMEEIGRATGLKSAVLAIRDPGLAGAIVKLLEDTGEVSQ